MYIFYRLCQSLAGQVTVPTFSTVPSFTSNATKPKVKKKSSFLPLSHGSVVTGNIFEIKIFFSFLAHLTQRVM